MAGIPLSFTVRYENDIEQHEKLRIPDGFRDVLDDGFLNIELSLSGDEKSWFVTLVHEECGSGWGTYLDAGWSDFVEDNGLDAGDALIFTYLGDSSFDVEICSPSGSKRVDRGGHDRGPGNSGKRRGRKPAIERLSSKMIETNACFAKLAAACREHHFLFTFTKAYVDQGIINVLFDFAKQHFIDFPEATDVILQNVETQFGVQLKVLKKQGAINKCSIRTGVSQFIDRYNVQIDVGALIYRNGNPIVFD